MANREEIVLTRYQVDTTEVDAASAKAEAALKRQAAAAATAAKSTELLTQSEKELAAKLIGVEAALKAKSTATGLTIAQVKKLEAANKTLAKAATTSATAIFPLNSETGTALK